MGLLIIGDIRYLNPKDPGHSLRSVATHGRKSGHWVPPYALTLQFRDYSPAVAVQIPALPAVSLQEMGRVKAALRSDQIHIMFPFRRHIFHGSLNSVPRIPCQNKPGITDSMAVKKLRGQYRGAVIFIME